MDNIMLCRASMCIHVPFVVLGEGKLGSSIIPSAASSARHHRLFSSNVA